MVKKVFILCLLSVILSCSKEQEVADNKTIEKPPVVDTGCYVLFNHQVGYEPVARRTPYRINLFDTVEISTFKYYISNVKLQREDSSWIAIRDQYWLVDDQVAMSKKRFLSVDTFGYIGISFLIGVDSARNVSGLQEGDLDPVLGMFWTWVSGYIQAKLEGRLITGNQPVPFIYHIGGFSGEHNPLQTVTLPFNRVVKHAFGTRKRIHITADIAKWFNGVHSISPRVYTVTIDPGPDALMMSQNYKNMFSVTDID